MKIGTENEKFYRPINHINADDSITKNITDSITVNETQKAIIIQMRKNPKITAKTLAEILGIADRNVKNHIRALKQAGIIDRDGSAKGGYWIEKGVGE